MIWSLSACGEWGGTGIRNLMISFPYHILLGCGLGMAVIGLKVIAFNGLVLTRLVGSISKWTGSILYTILPDGSAVQTAMLRIRFHAFSLYFLSSLKSHITQLEVFGNFSCHTIGSFQARHHEFLKGRPHGPCQNCQRILVPPQIQ
jgi:hypothetical protein